MGRHYYQYLDGSRPKFKICNNYRSLGPLFGLLSDRRFTNRILSRFDRLVPVPWQLGRASIYGLPANRIINSLGHEFDRGQNGGIYI